MKCAVLCHCERSEAISSGNLDSLLARRDCFALLAMTSPVYTTDLELLYVDVGLPLDIQHFFRIAKHAENWPNFIVRKGYIKEEFKQTKAKDPNARTSAFAPEDLFSNELGVIFANSLGFGDDMASVLEGLFKEVDELFSTNSVSDGKYLTKRRIERLKKIAQKYYGTDDLTHFTKESDIYVEPEITKINDNAEKKGYPFYKDYEHEHEEEKAD